MAKIIIPRSDNIKLYTTMLMSLLDELVLPLSNDKEYMIPLYFANGDRKYMRLQSKSKKPHPDYGTSFPMMSLSFLGTNKNVDYVNNPYLKAKGVKGVSYLPTRMDISYNLEIKAKTLDDATAISEFLHGVFQLNEYYVNMKLPFAVKPVSTPIVIDSIDIETEMNEDIADDLRLISINIPITVKNGLMINNVEAVDAIIKRIDLNIWYKKIHTQLIKEYKPLIEG